MAKQKPTQPEPTAELAVVETLPTEIAEMVQKSGLVITEAQSIAIQFAPFMQVVNEHAQIIAGIEKENPTEIDAKLARQHRLKLVENRGTKGLATLHTGLKENILVRGRYIDSLKNAVENASKLSEFEADAIEKHQERLDAKRKADLFDTRKAQLEPFGTDTTYLPLGDINEDQFARILENEQLAFNARKEVAEKLELARIEAERIAEANRLELARLQAERIEAERLEAIRVKEELAAREKELAMEREAARIEQERRDAELANEREAARLEQEKLQKEANERLERERAENSERERLRIEEENKAKELRAQLNKRFEQYAIKAVIPFGFVPCENGIENTELGWNIGSRHYDGFDTEIEMAEWVKDIQDRSRVMIIQKTESEKAQREQERLESELCERRELEAKEAESKRLAQLAPDKEKINAMYLLLRDLELPAFTSLECAAIATEVKNRISHILAYIKEESKKLS